MIRDGEWFVRKDVGKPHMAGWNYTAIKANPIGERDDGWVALASCPVCGALVLAEGGHRDLTGAHQQWHARTDHPIPAEIVAEAEAWRP